MPYVCPTGNHLLPDNGVCPDHRVPGRWIEPPPFPSDVSDKIASYLPVQDLVSYSSTSVYHRGRYAINPRLGEAVRSWSDAQTCTVTAPRFKRKFFLNFMEAALCRPKLAEYLIHACSFKGVNDSIKGNCVLLIRFFDGTTEGLLPPSQSKYTNTNTTTTLTMGSSEAHVSGQKENSPFVSMTGHLPSLLKTSCGAVRMIMYGPSETHLKIMSQGIPIKGVHPRAAAIGVFLVAGCEWQMPTGSTSDRMHLALGENEVLFDTRKGSLLTDFLFKIDNVV